MSKISKFELAVLLLSVLISIFFLVMSQVDIYSVLSLISVVSNVICVILITRKDIRNYFPGLVGVLSYGIVSYHYGNTGEWMLNFGFYMPIQFIGYYMWKKNLTLATKNEVHTRKLKISKTIIITLTMFIAVYLYAYLMSMTGVQMFLYKKTFDHSFTKYMIDSFTTVASVYAQMLVLLRYREQWYIWILVDIFAVILWIITFNPILILQWLLMLVLAVRGIIKWSTNNSTVL